MLTAYDTMFKHYYFDKWQDDPRDIAQEAIEIIMTCPSPEEVDADGQPTPLAHEEARDISRIVSRYIDRLKRTGREYQFETYCVTDAYRIYRALYA